jgi:uncharacterized membrane protein
MSKHTQWLHEQLKSWADEGLLSPEQAAQLRERYPEPKAAAPWGVIIFSGLGAVVCGLGVILLFAYNWQAIPKGGKLAIIFASIAAAHIGGLKLFVKDDWRKSLGDALTILGTMLFGSGIWLVAQIYHIDEHFPNGFLIWGIGALALAWAMPSIAQGALAVVLLTIWACTETWGFDHAIHFAPFLILLAAGGLSRRLQSRVLLVFTITAFTVTLLAAAGQVEGGLVLPVWLYMAAAFVAVGKLCRRHGNFANSEPVWKFFGWLGFLICLYLFTFPDAVDDLLDWNRSADAPNKVMANIYSWSALGVAILAWCPLMVEQMKQRAVRDASRPDWGDLWLVPLTPLLVQVICLTRLNQQEWLVAGPFNLIFLALAATWMAKGCREALLRPTILGSLLFGALMTGRYFDLFESLLMRGLVFLTVGAILFAEGILFMRNRRFAQQRGAVT